jgi:hypothetical protein
LLLLVLLVPLLLPLELFERLEFLRNLRSDMQIGLYLLQKQLVLLRSDVFRCGR